MAKYIIGPQDPTKVIDSTALPPEIDPKVLAMQLLNLQAFISSSQLQAAQIKQQLIDIYTQVPTLNPTPAATPN